MYLNWLDQSITKLAHGYVMNKLHKFVKMVKKYQNLDIRNVILYTKITLLKHYKLI